MRRIHLLAAFLCIPFTYLLSQNTAFHTAWTHFGEDAPFWFTDGTEAITYGDNAFSGVERGIVYNSFTNHVYVSSRHAIDTSFDGSLDIPDPHIYILDPSTGLPPETGITELSMQGITYKNIEGYGGKYPLNNITTTDDGKIIGCNLTLASGPDITNDDGSTTIKAFRVYLWDSETSEPVKIIDYKEGGYRLGDYISVIGSWESTAYIYSGVAESNTLLCWKVISGIVDSVPEVIPLEEVSKSIVNATVAATYSNSDSVYVSGKAYMPTLFRTDGTRLTQVSISTNNLPSSLVGGRTIKFKNRLYMAMFSGDQSAFIFDVTDHGENVTDDDVIGFTPTFGTKFFPVFGAGAVEMGIINDSLFVFVCAPGNGVACFRIDSFITNDPVARDVELSLLLKGSFDYFDADGDAPGASRQIWYTADSIDGPKTQVAYDTNFYKPNYEEISKIIFYGVTPVSLDGQQGKEVLDTVHLAKTFYDTTIVVDTIFKEIRDTITVMVYDSIAVTDTLIIDIGVNNITHRKNLLKIYPNPTYDMIYINSGEYYQDISGYSLRIYNTLGESVFESKLYSQLISIDLSRFKTTGIYFVQIKDDEGHIIDMRKILLRGPE